MGDECNTIVYINCSIMLRLVFKWDEKSSPHDLLPLNSFLGYTVTLNETCGMYPILNVGNVSLQELIQFISSTKKLLGSIIGMCIDCHLGKKDIHLSCFYLSKRQETRSAVAGVQ